MQLPSNLTQSEGYTYGFTPAGHFTLINRDGEDVYIISVTLLQRLFSHILWVFFWILLARFRTYFFFPIFFHLLMIGGRLTSLMIYGAIKPLLFPPLWERLSRRLFRGEGIELLRSHDLDRHPGLLVNLARSQANRNEGSEAERTLKLAEQLLDAKGGIS